MKIGKLKIKDLPIIKQMIKRNYDTQSKQDVLAWRFCQMRDEFTQAHIW